MIEYFWEDSQLQNTLQVLKKSDDKHHNTQEYSLTQFYLMRA